MYRISLCLRGLVGRLTVNVLLVPAETTCAAREMTASSYVSTSEDLYFLKNLFY